MTDGNKPRVLIAGAGAMGLICGYHLALSGATVTFLVRPHRLADLEKAQIFYSYDDGTLKTYDGYQVVSDPRELSANEFDYILVTLDGSALRDPDGEKLTRKIGRIARGTPTRVVIGAIGIGLLPWFLAASGLAAEQVTGGSLAILCHTVASAGLPFHPPTDAGLLAQADLAYRHSFPFGFIVDDSALEVAKQFAELYSASGVSQCVVHPAETAATFAGPIFAQLAAWDIAGWPQAAETDAGSDFWQLATNATKEILGLSIYGLTGRNAQNQTTASSLLEFWRGWEKTTRPLDLQGFNQLHHGVKVNRQDRKILSDLIAVGKTDGREMPATQELLIRQTALKSR